MLPSDRPPAAAADAAPTPSVDRARRKPDRPAQRALPFGDAGTGNGGRPERRPRARRLWLCLDFPLLPLEALERATGPRAVVEECRGMRQVLLADAPAEAAGVRTGMPVPAALALLPQLALEARDLAREAATLKKLAAWAECFTPLVSLEPPALLLEIGGSLRLFDGPHALRERITGDLERRGFSVASALAPTPRAALWLARSGREACVEEAKHLAGALAPVPLACVAWPEATLEALAGMGVTCVGDCLRLPRQGFVQRFGAAPLLELDRALGRLPEPRASHRQPARFSRECELSGEIDDRDLLLAACRRLLGELERFLLGHQLAVRAARFSFFHLRSKATVLEIGRRQGGGGLESWCRLLALRFERLDLPEPVIAIRLDAGHGEPRKGTTASLPFPGRDGCTTGTAPVEDLLERLAARLGTEAVHGLALAAEHRPQHAWRAARPAARSLPQPVPPDDYRPHWLNPHWPDPSRDAGRLLLRRPLWLLPEPLPLPAPGAARAAPLILVSGPERIETGWWDGEGVARDYFVAVDGEGAELWIYRDRAQRGWYLHGLFG